MIPILLFYFKKILSFATLAKEILISMGLFLPGYK